jgi:hypothetical protein
MTGRMALRLGFIFGFFALLAPGAANAQEWVEFQDRVWGVEINFPHEPEAEDIQYTTYYQRQIPARVYSAEAGTGRYVLTIADYSGDQTDSLTAQWHASLPIRAKGEVTYFGFQDLDGIPGLIISVTEPDGGLIQASVYFVAQRLYIAEGRIGPGNPPPSNFQQSINIIGPDGERIILDDDLDFP